MPNLLQTSAAWLGQRLADPAVAGRVGVFKRVGSTPINPVTATPAEMDYPVVDQSGLPTGSTVASFLFTASDLVIDGLQIEPRASDVFTETLNGVNVIWEAMPPAATRKVWEWADSSGVLIKVFFKRVAG